MEFRTIVDIPRPPFEIGPCEEILLVGSCFADYMGRRLADEKFRVTCNPFGTMYNPVSILHTVERCQQVPRIVFLTLGTNHIYRLRETGQVVDNCQKQPQRLFREEELSVDDCADYLRQTVNLLRSRRPDVQVVLTVSPVRYRKYGFHGSQLSKATLLLAVQTLLSQEQGVTYFPAYEIVMDELRDYRFYAADMAHPSDQAVDYIWERLSAHYLSPSALAFLDEWRPLRQLLAHRPFHPKSEAYQRLMDDTRRKIAALQERYPGFTHIA